MTARVHSASVVVPVRNGEKTIGRCLEALNRQTAGDLEIIVVDDGSTDRTGEIARAMRARVVTQAPSGPAAARNQGAREASAEIVLFTDADCAPRSNWASAMLDGLADPTVTGCRGVYVTEQTSRIARFVQAEYDDKYRATARRAQIDFVDTYSAGYRRQVILDVGFDQAFRDSSVEDQELSFRLAAEGHKLVFVPEAIVEHLHPATLRAYARKKFKIGFYKPQVHQRHRERVLSDSHTPPVLRLQTLSAALALAVAAPGAGWRQRVKVAVALTGGILISALPLTWRVTRKDREIGMLVPIMALIRAFSLAAGLYAGTARLVWVHRRGWQPSGGCGHGLPDQMLG